MGYLKPKTNIQRLAYRLQGSYPKIQFTQRLEEKNPDTWVAEIYRDLPFIYSTPQNTRPSRFYYYQGQLLAQQQLVLAGYRLADLLNQELS